MVLPGTKSTSEVPYPLTSVTFWMLASSGNTCRLPLGQQNLPPSLDMVESLPPQSKSCNQPTPAPMAQQKQRHPHWKSMRRSYGMPYPKRHCMALQQPPKSSAVRQDRPGAATPGFQLAWRSMAHHAAAALVGALFGPRARRGSVALNGPPKHPRRSGSLGPQVAAAHTVGAAQIHAPI